MSTISYANFWKDIGYTENCMEVPKATATLTTPDLSFTDLNPSKARMFSELRVPEDYVTMLDYSYMSIVVENNNGADKTYYGWIDSVEMTSDTLNAPITTVRWHVDLWRTYYAQAEFGSGMVRRRTLSADVPPQPYPVRYYTPEQVWNLIPTSLFWVIVNVVKNTEGGTPEDPVIYSEFETRCYPISRNNATHYVGSSVTAYKVPSFNDTVAGRWDELWGIDPSSVVSAFVAPIPPAQVTGGGTSADPYNIYGWAYAGTGSYGYAYYKTSSTNYFGPSYPKKSELNTSLMTTDTTKYVFTGFDGEVIGELPWGRPIRYYTYRLVMSATSCYLEFRFSNTSGVDPQEIYMDAHANGTCFTIPCVALDISSNNWSSYVYGGQRQYDMQSRQYEADRALQQGQMDVVTNALLGSMGGASSVGSSVAGWFGGGVAGSVAGGLAATAATEGALLANYAYTTGVYNDQMLQLEDYKQSIQANGILTPGTGWDSVFYGRVPSIVEMEADTYSTTQRNNDITIYGAHVSEPLSDCSTLIASEGPLQIDNLIVKGDIPPVAKSYIKQRFAQGVIIK